MGDEIEKPLQGSLFEEDYLVRTLGAISSSPEVAMTELVANAWDAGASRVRIVIPPEPGRELVVEDDGSGMTPDQFRRRWMTLGYDRTKHQGTDADFPPERSNWHRQAYGRNGVGRHALLCFADEYEVQTKRDGQAGKFVISTASGRDPFILRDAENSTEDGHGTCLSVRVTRNLPRPEKIRAILSSRFLSDPNFTILVNDISVPLTEHTGLLDRQQLKIAEGVIIEAFFLEVSDTSKRVLHHGVAFWIGKRLVGTPSWTLGDRVLLDGRTRLAKRHTVVIKSEDLFSEVLPDWSAFRPSGLVDKLFDVTGDYVADMLRKLAAGQIEETKEAVFREHKEEIETLQPLAKLEISEFVDELTNTSATLSQEFISLAVQAAINLEKTRSGSALLEKLSRLSEEDIEGLDRLLKDWSIRDALTVLDEIDRRLAVIEALAKLSRDASVDELHTLHPLVTQARWLFGPEFDSPEYSSNSSLVNAVQRVFKKRLAADAFINAKRRPDLVILSDASLSIVGTETFERDSTLLNMRSILIIELKRGASEIGRNEISQASGYLEDLLSSGAIDGNPYVHAFVVGHRIHERTLTTHKVGDRPEVGRVEACTYSQLVRTAERRLFRLRDQLQSRYGDVSGNDLLQRVLSEPHQLKLKAS